MTRKAIRTGHLPPSFGFSVSCPPLEAAVRRSTTSVFRFQYWGNALVGTPSAASSTSSFTAFGAGGSLWLQGMDPHAVTIVSATRHIPAARIRVFIVRSLLRTD